MTLDELKARAKADLDNAFEKGKAQGGGGGLDYDMMWDGLQNYGNTTDYAYFCYGKAANGWFRPKYDIRPKKADYFMRDFGNEIGDKDTDKHIDLVELLNECGVTLDFSQCTSVTYLFYRARVKRIGVIDLTGLTNDSGANNLLFGDCTKVIDELIVKDNLLLERPFTYATRLESLRIGGTIGKNFSVNKCVLLDAESYHSIVTHWSKTASFTVTLPAYNTVRTVYDAKYGERAWGNILKEYPNVTVVYS